MYLFVVLVAACGTGVYIAPEALGATETEVLFNLRPPPSTSLGDPPLFEDDPRGLAFNPSHAGASSVYVWIGQ